MVGRIYPTELQLNKASPSDSGTLFLNMNLSITNGKVSSKIYDKRGDFNFEIVTTLIESPPHRIHQSLYLPLGNCSPFLKKKSL